MKNRVESVFLKWWIHQQLQCVQQYKVNFTFHCLHAHIRWESTHIGWSRTCSIDFIFSYKIIARVIYSGVFKETLTKQLYCSRSEPTVFWGAFEGGIKVI